jgi:hypothetical protein
MTRHGEVECRGQFNGMDLAAGLGLHVSKHQTFFLRIFERERCLGKRPAASALKSAQPPFRQCEHHEAMDMKA